MSEEKKPKMRLIDANAINPIRCPQSIEEMRKWINEQPTVKAEPEHGHWIISGEWCTCSECKQSLHYERSKGKSSIINALSMAVYYCPNCGAKMDGKVEHESD